MSDPVLIDRDALAELVARAAARPRWLDVAGAAVYASVAPISIRRLIASGQLTAHRPLRGKLLIDRFQLDAVVGSATSIPRTGRGRSSR